MRQVPEPVGALCFCREYRLVRALGYAVDSVPCGHCWGEGEKMRVERDENLSRNGIGVGSSHSSGGKRHATVAEGNPADAVVLDADLRACRVGSRGGGAAFPYPVVRAGRARDCT